MENLEKFIVKAKTNGWVGSETDGKKIDPSRLGSFDITFEEGDFFYHDSFVGFTDFCGQEHICYKGEPVWSQVYYGYLVRPDIFNGARTVEILKLALASMYRENRFLGKFKFHHEECQYVDENQGDFRNFHGIEKIFLKEIVVYELRYFGGLVRK